MISGMEVLESKCVAERVDVSLEWAALERNSITKTSSGCRILGVIDAVVRKSPGQFARINALQRGRPRKTAELNLFEQQLGRLAESGDVRRAPAVCESDVSEASVRKFPHRV